MMDKQGNSAALVSYSLLLLFISLPVTQTFNVGKFLFNSKYNFDLIIFMVFILQFIKYF